ncbi:MAG: nuclear transport factor 2 family protein [Gammaproteobacteria bacterium]|nr:nuclear transport factor 2 family protein [Gammaproteobacteria bacterium]
MLSQQELSDRFEIQDLCYRYAEIIDSKDFDALRGEIFTADAHIDYSVFGGSVGGLEDTIDFLKQALTNELFPAHQHLNANLQVTLAGDEASGRIMCFNPQQISLGEEDSQLFMLGLWYLDKYVRTQQGWRICERIEEKSWVFNTPDFMQL